MHLYTNFHTKTLYEVHGATIKIVNAQQAKLNNNYKNTKLKLLKRSNFKCFSVKIFI